MSIKFLTYDLFFLLKGVFQKETALSRGIGQNRRASVARKSFPLERNLGGLFDTGSASGDQWDSIAATYQGALW